MKGVRRMKSLDIRWIQRFENFSKACELLAEIENQDIDDMPAIVREGFIQRFEYTFELLWKTIKDFLENEGVDIGIISPKNVIRAAASSGLLELMGADGEVLLDMLEQRNLMSHTYDASKFEQALLKIKKEYLPQVYEVRKYFASKRLNDG